MLLISQEFKAIYLHNPKVAGTYLKKILIKYYKFTNYNNFHNKKTIEDHEIFAENSNIDKLIISKEKKFNSFTCQFRKKGIYRYFEDIIKREEYKDFFKFTFVRNPYTKIISAWKYSNTYSKENDFYYKDSEEIHQDDYEFDEYLKEAKETCTDYAYFHSFITQTDHLINSENKIDFDFIGKLENLKEDLITVLTKLNIKDHIHLETNEGLIPLNLGMKTKPNSYYLTKENINIINNYFKDDFINFNYEFKE